MTAEPTPIVPRPGSALLSAAAVRRIDARVGHELAMPSILLMERAGLAATGAVMARFPDAGEATIVVGPGNNGGDGMVVARHLQSAGWSVRVLAPDGRRPGGPDSTTMTTIAERLGLVVEPLDTGSRLEGVVVDALLGTGSVGAPRGPVAAAINAINASCGPVVSVDMPSGVSADTGRVDGVAVRAHLTVTFHAEKLGLYIAPGRVYAGLVEVADIGIPAAISEPPSAWLIERAALDAIDARRPEIDKYAAGAVLLVAGSPGMVGAAALAARAALRAGAGIVFSALAQELLANLTALAPEVVGIALDGDHDALTAITSQLTRVSAVAIGPGLGRASAAGSLVRALLETVDHPVVLDADGLWHVTLDDLARRVGRTVITPHAGEAARLLGCTRDEVDAGRLDAARELSRRGGVVAVLKGSGTLVVGPDGAVGVDALGGPELATAGSGDVLTGIIGSLLATGLDPWSAACASVAVHSLSGQAAGKGRSTMASDLVEAIPTVIGAR